MGVLSKIHGRIEVAMLSADARRVRAERLTYLAPKKLRRLEQALLASLAATQSGEVLEFGVALGGSAVLLAKRARAAGRRFWGFDVFGMIPPPTSERDDEKSKARYDVIASGRSEGIGGTQYYGYRPDLYGEVCATFNRHGIPPDGTSVRLVKGLFEQTWSSYDAAPIAFVHVDCDWYDPVRFCLEAVADKLVRGGAVVLDDYNDYGGCKTAVDEFMAGRSDFTFNDGPNPILVRA